MECNGYSIFACNFSNTGYKREIPDTRHEECKKKVYDDLSNFPTASVVICFYHEELMTLLRTVHSVVDRSPRQLLKEVILVDDHSDIDITANLTMHLSENEDLKDLVRVVRPLERSGLIRSRIFGSREASGDVLVFLDSHVEANVNWLEPLLDRIAGTQSQP